MKTKQGYSIVEGNVFMVMNDIRRIGGIFKPSIKKWIVPTIMLNEANKLIEYAKSLDKQRKHRKY